MKYFTGFAGKISAIIRFKMALRSDERVRFMDEIISSIKVIKMYAWEKPFAQLIAVARRLELEMVLKNSYISAIFFTLNIFASRIALFSTLLCYVHLYGSENMTVSKIFMATTLFNSITANLNIRFVNSIIDQGYAYMAVKRLQMFLEYEEISKTIDPDLDVLEARDLAILMKCVSAEWSIVDDCPKSVQNVQSYENSTKNDGETNIKCKPFRLQEINLQVPRGKLIIVFGPVGSGKSSLLHILVKELPINDGILSVNGSISYANQECWIFPSTIRQNIIFDQPMDRSRYEEVIENTALSKDLLQFKKGDLTLIGQHGAGLSGGQKARVK